LKAKITDNKSYRKEIGDKTMKNILTVLIASCLFAFSFTFNSCKACKVPPYQDSPNTSTTLPEEPKLTVSQLNERLDNILSEVALEQQVAEYESDYMDKGNPKAINQAVNKVKELEQEAKALKEKVEKAINTINQAVNKVKELAQEANALKEKAELGSWSSEMDIKMKAIWLLSLRAEFVMSIADHVRTTVTEKGSASAAWHAKINARDTFDAAKDKPENKAARDLASKAYVAAWSAKGKSKRDARDF
jgi:flagellar hook-basal body complex protein FliE